MGNENALAIIQKAREGGALVFVNQDNFQSGVELYKTEATVIRANPDEFHKIDTKFMPSRPVTDRIGEAAGVEFVSGDVRAETRDDATAGKRTVFIGTAQGKVRMPDGHWRMSAVEEYEFDPVLRAMLDKRVDYITETNRGVFARAAMEYTKAARQRAATGARLRVIRQLTGMPTAFSADDIKKPMVFTRIVQDTSHILDTKEGRTLATMQALGITAESLYGKRQPIEEERVEQMPSVASESDDNFKPADTSGFDDTVPADTASLAAQANPAGSKSPEDQEFENLSVSLEALIESNKEVINRETRTGNPYKLAKEELDSFAATIESRKAMITKITNFLEALKKGATA